MTKKKVGKQRKDKFYQLAKETGYRSRAAFKLIQLNRKFEFLQKSRVCLDLCAAPGGWMQVAKQNMPVSSIVIGVDLFPIKPITGCVSITGDITTDQCAHAISKELQNWKVDVVLHDGAPNVGQNWLFDAYQQVCLTLSSFKLATKFLKQGGWFVTKVFRSKDYNALLWVLKQFFKKVHATKPQASRTESAEIFVVCCQYSAPSKIDPRFLDPKYVFKELDLEPTIDKHFLRPDKMKKPKAEGYSEKHPVFREFSVEQFINCENHLEVLQAASCIVLDDETINNQPETTREIRECCKDIKVLGRKDLKSLLSWAKILYERLYSEDNKEIKTEPVDSKKEGEEDLTSDDEELAALDAQIADLENEDRKESKRKKKKSQKERSKLRQQLELKMVHKGDDGPIEEDPMEPMFNLNQITTHKELEGVTDQIPDIVAESDVESEEEESTYRSRSVRYNKDEVDINMLDPTEMAKGSEEESNEDSDDDNSGLGFSSDEDDDKEKVKKKKVRFSEEVKEEKEEIENPLLTDLDTRDAHTKRTHKADLWFHKDVFKNLEVDQDEEFELTEFSESIKKEGGTVLTKKPSGGKDQINENSDSGIETTAATEGSDDDDDDSDSDSDSDYSVEDEMGSTVKFSNKSGDFEIAPKDSHNKKKRKLDEEGLALGALMIQSKKRREELIDGGWNRFAFNDTNLPDWYQEYQQLHMKKEAPVPKELIEEYKKKKNELNVRPIKKVIEAKARKKKRALKKLEMAKKKMAGLMDNPDVPEREKARQIQRMYKKAMDKKPEVTYVVAKKHSAARRMKRPKGVKGRYKVVDPRMKKDARKEKLQAKSGKKGGKGKPKGKVKVKNNKKANNNKSQS